MKARTLAVLILMALAVPVRADSADDAEAARRKVTVAQVQAEKALEAEKKKSADLTTKLASLKKKLADMEAKEAQEAAANAAANPATTMSGDGMTMYKDFMRRYLAGDWEKLAADLSARDRDIKGLPVENAANLAYVKEAVIEGRQPWWDAVKGGKAVPFKATVWKKEVNVAYSNAAVKFAGPAAAQTVAMSWPKDSMDSFDAMSLSDVGLMMGGGNFRKGDGINQLIWSYMGYGEMYTTVGADKIKAFSAAEKAQFGVYMGFWSTVTAAYYGTPPARRLIMVQALASFEQVNDQRPDWLGKRPIGTSVLIEMKTHKALYKSVEIMQIIGLDKGAKDGHEFEMLLAKPVVLGMSGAKLTFEEDKALREVFKTLAESNTTWNVPKLSLPHDLSYDLNVENDLPLAAERRKYLGN
ncbi:MAG TPA: hypothetical protein VGN88_08140 [Phycisphaerae bacterium]